MTKLLELVGDVPRVDYAAGEMVIAEGKVPTELFILVSGEVEIRKQGTTICKISTQGSAFGELAALLGVKSTASVIAVKPSTFVVVKDAASFVSENHAVTLEIARLLAHRVNWMTYQFMTELDDGDSVFWSGKY